MCSVCRPNTTNKHTTQLVVSSDQVMSPMVVLSAGLSPPPLGPRDPLILLLLPSLPHGLEVGVPESVPGARGGRGSADGRRHDPAICLEEEGERLVTQDQPDVGIDLTSRVEGNQADLPVVRTIMRTEG